MRALLMNTTSHQKRRFCIVPIAMTPSLRWGTIHNFSKAVGGHAQSTCLGGGGWGWAKRARTSTKGVGSWEKHVLNFSSFAGKKRFFTFFKFWSLVVGSDGRTNIISDCSERNFGKVGWTTFIFRAHSKFFWKKCAQGGSTKARAPGGCPWKKHDQARRGWGHKMPFFRARALCTATREGRGVGPTVTSCVKDSLSLTRRDRDKGEGRKLQNFALRK